MSRLTEHEFFVEEAQLKPLDGKVIVVTGTSSGIGLGTVELLLKVGAKVVAGDLNPNPTEHKNLSFIKTDVSNWSDQLALFKHAKELHGRIDHVFSNAGIAGQADYLTEKLDVNGELQEPPHSVVDINLTAMINTSYLGLYHFRHQDPPGGSIVCTASAASFNRFRAADYTAAKHGVFGWMRGMLPNIWDAKLPIRINAIAPSWTKTGLILQEAIDKLDAEWQTPADVAKSVAILMADESRQGQLIYSWAGRFVEVEETTLLPPVKTFVGPRDEDAVISVLYK